jgi:hypothetical protein
MSGQPEEQSHHDGLDLLFDVFGFTGAFLAMWGWHIMRSWKQQRKVKTSVV